MIMQYEDDAHYMQNNMHSNMQSSIMTNVKKLQIWEK